MKNGCVRRRGREGSLSFLSQPGVDGRREALFFDGRLYVLAVSRNGCYDRGGKESNSGAPENDWFVEGMFYLFYKRALSRA